MGQLDQGEVDALLKELNGPKRTAAVAAPSKGVKLPASKAVAAPGKRRRAAATPDYKMLVLAVVFLVGAAVYSVSGFFISNATAPDADTANADVAAEKRPALPQLSPAARSSASLLRPNGVWQSLGQQNAPELIPVSKLTPPKDGKTMLVYCVFYSPLDADTEKQWAAAGLFSAAKDVDPYVRRVAIKDTASYELLVDWRVEGVLLDLPGMNLPETRAAEEDELTAMK